MNGHKLSLIVPVYKSENFIKNNLEEMKKSLSRFISNFEIIAVIDGMVDNSFHEVSKVDGIKVVSYLDNMGKGHAIKHGFEHATGDVVTFIDADMDLHPDQLVNFFPYLATADMVIGSKRHPFSKLHYPFIRKVMSKGYQMFSWLMLGVNLKDTQSGLKIIKKEVLDVIMPLIVVKRYAFDLELCFLAHKHGFRIVEAPLMIDFKNNGSGVGLKAVYGMFIDTLAIRYRYSILRHYQKYYHKIRFRRGDGNENCSKNISENILGGEE